MASYTDILDENIVNGIASMVSQYLRDKANDPIAYPDRNGAFPSAGRSIMFTHEPLIVVPDTNYLLNSVKTACQKDKRTILVTAANFGALRLFCAQHVIDEVYEHSPEFAEKAGVTHAEYLRRFEREYLPLLRLVDNVESSECLLTDAERARVSILRAMLSKDVPSAMLSIILDAYYLTRDKEAFRTAYGRDQTKKEFDEQTELLKAAGDADARGQFLFYLALFPTLLFTLVGSPFEKVPDRFRWLLWAGGAIGAAALAYFTYRNREHMGGLGTRALQVITALYGPVMENSGVIRQSGPGQPTWETLADEIDPRSATTRAMLHGLARSELGTMSARDLAKKLPTLNVGQGEAIVRGVLRGRTAWFSETRAGRFQVGKPILGTGTASHE